MILVLLGISIALLVVGSIMVEKMYNEIPGYVLCVIGGAGGFIFLIATLCLTIEVSSLSTIDDKISMYQEENAKIEADIAATVAQYQEYETGIFTSVAPDSSMTLVALYPDLKSDTLVQKQIEVYIENNNKIKELKAEQISGSVKRWWLYFGG